VFKKILSNWWNPSKVWLVKIFYISGSWEIADSKESNSFENLKKVYGIIKAFNPNDDTGKLVEIFNWKPSPRSSVL
jgi:hypothetical protein